MIAPPVYPATDLDFLANEGLVNLAAIVSTHHDVPGKP
jgi:hypothetical protein